MYYYVRHSQLDGIEEDLKTEFKAHRELSNVDLSDCRYVPASNGGFTNKLPRRRKAISDSICGMLNTGLKSTLHLGVTDEGQVEGFAMTLYQREHFLLSLQDLLERYSPCPSKRVETRFIPVIDEDEKEQQGVQPEQVIHRDTSTSRWLGHCVRDSRYCWCDTDSLAICANGSIPRFYVIEITLAAWDPMEDTIRPIFKNEYNKIYVRRNGYVEHIETDKEIKALKNTNFNSRLAENCVSLFEVSDTDFYSYDEDDD